MGNMNTKNIKVDRIFWIAVAVGLIIRLLVIPLSTTDEADAVTRIFIAQDWMDNPGIITYGIWGPLQTYLIAASLFIWNNAVYAPAVMNCLFSAATAIPLYYFVKREWNENAALFTACLYLVYPVAFRYGLVALSDVPFIFFIALTLLFLSLARDQNGTWKHAVLAGLTLTMAGALRYEAWGLTPFFGLVLWKKWKKEMLLFYFTAALFPIFWMTGNYFQTGDPLYSFTWSVDWNINIGQNNADISTVDMINRATFFPRVLFFGLTPLAFLACILGIFFVIQKRRPQAIWLIPLAVLFATFTLNSINGQLAIQVRYSLGLAVLMIPFIAEWFESFKDPARRLRFSAIVILSMVPFAFLRYIVPWPFDFPNPIPKQIFYIPNANDSAKATSTYVNQELEKYPGGFILDFRDWGETYYIALMSGQRQSDIYMTPGEVNEPLIPSEITLFFDKNPSGLLLITDESRFLTITKDGDQEVLQFIGYDYEKPIYVHLIGEIENNTIYNYTLNP
jgi:4-amino-4-deoxy-L-arabinose transferase-like glycosyltransferase